MTIINTQFLTN